MLSLCVWKVAVEETRSDDGDYLPPGLFHTCEDFEFIYKEVKTFCDNLLQNLPDVSRVCEHYYRLYGIEWVWGDFSRKYVVLKFQVFH